MSTMTTEMDIFTAGLIAPAAKKGTTPELVIPGMKEKVSFPVAPTQFEEIALDVAFERATMWLNDAEGRKDDIGAKLVALCEPHRAALATQTHRHVSSINVGALRYTFSPTNHQTSVKDPLRIVEVMARCRTIGTDFFKYIAPKYTIDPTPENIAKCKAAGVAYQTTIQPTKAFHENRQSPEVAELFALLPEFKPTAFMVTR